MNIKKNILIVSTILSVIVLGILSFNIFSVLAMQNAIKDADIQSFNFGYGSWNTIYSTYEIIKNEDYILMKFSDSLGNENNYDISNETLQQIEQLILKRKVYTWDGFDKEDKYIIDGNSFTLKIEYENGENISASGYMKFPRNYNSVEEEIVKILNKEIKNNY